MTKPARRLANGLLLTLFAGLLLGGCWDRREIEDVALVLAMGLDRAPGDNRVMLTVQIAVPRSLGGNTGSGMGDPGTPPSLVESVEAETVTEGLRDLETFLNRRVTFMHLKTIVFGRELAQAGIDAHLGVLTRNREFRRTIMLMVADGTAKEAMTLQPVLEKEPALYLEDLTRRAYERTARAPRVNLHRFLAGYESLSEEPVLPILHPRATNPGLQNQGGPTKGQLFGSAIFLGPRMVGELTPAETEMLLLLTGRINRFIEAVPAPADERYQVVIDLTMEDREVTVDPRGSVPVISVKIKTEAEIREIEKHDGLLQEHLPELERALVKGMEEKAHRLMRRLQEELRSDSIGFGNYARLWFLDWPTWSTYNWREQFPKAKVNISFQATIRRVGMTFQPVKPR